MPTISVNRQQFRERLDELLSAAATGGVEVIIEEAGQVTLKLQVVEQAKRGPLILNMHPGAVMSEDFTEPIIEKEWLANG